MPAEQPKEMEKADRETLTYLGALALVALLLGAGFVFFASQDDGTSLIPDSLSTTQVPQAESPVITGESPTGSTSAEAAPAEADWETEDFTALAETQLRALGDLMAFPAKLDAQQLRAFTAESFLCQALRSAELTSSFEGKSLAVRRATDSTDGTSELAFKGVEGLLKALQQMAQPFAADTEIQFAFKVVRIDLLPKSATTTVLVQSSGQNPDGFVQQNATWRCRWQQAGETPLLERIHVDKYEEVLHPGDGGKLFSDCTLAVMGHEPSFQEQLALDITAWRRNRLQAEIAVGMHGHQGVALGDVNGDGLDDVYVCQPSGLPNRLFVQQRDGTVSDKSAGSGVNWLDHTRVALFTDLDNDGDQDLAIGMNASLMLLSNDGSGRFSEQVVLNMASEPQSITAADYDNDGDLDLYSTGLAAEYGDTNEVSLLGRATPFPFHDANNGAPNTLLRNEGQWTFADVTEQCGLEQNNRRFSFAASWEDYDNDGDLDLYVANDNGRNNLYRNDAGQFTDVAAAAGVEDIASGMSVSWADYNGDGWMDLYVGNMFSSAGNRVAFQRQFQQHVADETRQLFQRHARGNSLFLNAGDGTFRDVSEDASVTMGRWAWGSKFVDLNNDGLEDIFVTNGFLTGPDKDDL